MTDRISTTAGGVTADGVTADDVTAADATARRRSTTGKLNRYTAVSVVAALANVIVYSSWLRFTDLHPTVANALSAGMVALPTFLVNRRWSWNVRRAHSVKREVLPYYLFTVVNVTLSTTVAWFLAEAGARDSVLVLATVAVYTTTWALRFLFLDRLLFAPRG